MKKFIYIFIVLMASLNLNAQNAETEKQGIVSFISSENVYVKFASTVGIHTGDTLFYKINNKYQPGLVITELSSISCVGKLIGAIKPTLSTTLFAILKPDFPLEVAIEKTNESVSVNDEVIQGIKKNEKNTDISGRFSVSSYINTASNPLVLTTPNFRLKYNLAFNADSIAGSGFSFENYMSYTHTLFNPNEDYKDLRIYNLALKYDFKNKASLIFGRKINANTANIGAVDGFQFEKKLKNFTVGALIGTRPNDTTYSLDTKLFQYGAFVSHNYQKDLRTMQTSLAFFNQTNQLVTDRRYLYLQHANSLIKNVDFFGSAELDLYAVENNIPINDFDLTSIYVSLTYRPVKELSLSASFDARRNVYYYETYKNRIDSLLEKEMRQGLRFRFNYHPFKYFSWGGTAGYRVQTPTSHESMNAMSYLTYSSLPWIDASLTVSATALSTSIYSGFIYGANMSKDFLDGKLALDVEYRKAQIFAQDIAEIGVMWRITNDIILSTDFEATFEENNTTGRIFFNISKRF